MKFQKWALTFLMLLTTLALATVNVLAQDTATGSESAPPDLRLMFFLVGAVALFFLFLNSSESSNNDNGQ